MASALDKFHCAERELALRLRVYRQRIAHGHMREEEARREIALMEEIAADYRALAEGEPPGPLFAAGRTCRECGALAAFVIDGRPLCRQHAGVFAVDVIRGLP